MFERPGLHVGDFSWSTALALARASQVAYARPEQIRKIATRKWGLDECRPFDIGDTQGFVGWDEHSVIVAFRGTESVGDWLGNLRLARVEREYGGVHGGFYRAYRMVANAVSAALADAGAETKRVWLTGHSLGGAVAMLTAAELRGSLEVSGVHTFGQPKTVSAAAAQWFDRTFPDRYHRFVNDDDVVPTVPPRYEHCGRLHWFRPGGLRVDTSIEGLAVESTSSAGPHELGEADFSALQKSLRETRDSLAGLEGHVEAAFDVSVEGLLPSISDHAMRAYIAQIRRQLGGRSKADPALHELRSGPPMDPTLEGLESLHVEAPPTPVLLIVNRPDWQPPAGFQVQSRLGTVVTGSASPAQVSALIDDAGVVSIEKSREGGTFELAQSTGFVGANQVHQAPTDERGDGAIVGLIDTGVDILHEAFLDAQRETRVDFVWNQRNASGPSPHQVDPRFTQTYGTLYAAAHLRPMVASGQVSDPALRDPQLHGTHVASIAAGRASGPFAGGVAPAARLCVVIPKMATSPGDPASLGYSISHLDALAFLDTAADVLGKPIVVNVSLGMNAGAHDGSSALEAGFDAFTGGGRTPGRVVVKSAGNERGHGGHAATLVAEGAVTPITWDSLAPRVGGFARWKDYIEVWYSGFDDIEFTLIDPAGRRTAVVSVDHLFEQFTLGGNDCELELTPNHRDNGDNLLAIRIARSGSAAIQPGAWTLEMGGREVNALGRVDAWVERDSARGVRFQTGVDDDKTLSIPGTARHVICVAACESRIPARTISASSKGLTRDERPKPDLCAPGADIVAARANAAPTATVAMPGTSMAAPHVSGSIALVLSLRQKSAKPQVNASQVRSALQSTTQNFNGRHTPEFGFGVLDTLAFFQRF